jgi:hypothetical protein
MNTDDTSQRGSRRPTIRKGNVNYAAPAGASKGGAIVDQQVCEVRGLTREIRLGINLFTPSRAPPNTVSSLKSFSLESFAGFPISATNRPLSSSVGISTEQRSGGIALCAHRTGRSPSQSTGRRTNARSRRRSSLAIDTSTVGIRWTAEFSWSALKTANKLLVGCFKTLFGK